MLHNPHAKSHHQALTQSPVAPPLHSDASVLTVFLYTGSLSKEQIQGSLQHLPLVEPLTELAHFPTRTGGSLFTVRISTDSYLSLQSVLHHDFASKLKIYTNRDLHVFFDGKLNTLYADNLHPAFNEDDVRLLFEPMGDLEHVHIHELHSTRRAIITYRREDDARKALLRINNLSLGCGVRMRVGLYNQQIAANIQDYLLAYQTLSLDEKKKHYEEAQEKYNEQRNRLQQHYHHTYNKSNNS